MRVAELDQAAHEAEDRYHELQQDWEQVLEMSEQHEQHLLRAQRRFE